MMNKHEKPISRRILVMHSRALTQLIEIRSRSKCRHFPSFAAMAARVHRSTSDRFCQEGVSA